MNIRKTLALVASVLGLLSACARDTGYHPPEALPPPNLQGDGDKTAVVNVRVIVQFKVAQAYDDEAFVTTLQVHAQVPMHYIAAVSTDTHVYGLELPASQDPAAAIQRLRALPSVARVDIDSKAKGR